MKTSILITMTAISLISLPVFAQTGDNVADEKTAGYHPVTNHTGRLSSLTCWQSGQMIFEEKDILNFQPFSDGMFHGDRADGTKVIFKGVDSKTGVFCRIVEREK